MEYNRQNMMEIARMLTGDMSIDELDKFVYNAILNEMLENPVAFQDGLKKLRNRGFTIRDE